VETSLNGIQERPRLIAPSLSSRSVFRELRRTSNRWCSVVSIIGPFSARKS